MGNFAIVFSFTLNTQENIQIYSYDLLIYRVELYIVFSYFYHFKK